MKDDAKVMVFGLVAFAVTIIVISGLSLGLKGSLGVWSENIDRKIYEQNRSHVHGTIEHLTRLKLEYETASDEHKVALRAAILTTVSSFDEDKLPVTLQSFINTLRN